MQCLATQVKNRSDPEVIESMANIIEMLANSNIILSQACDYEVFLLTF